MGGRGGHKGGLYIMDVYTIKKRIELRIGWEWQEWMVV